jgi:hypothetical protein
MKNLKLVEFNAENVGGSTVAAAVGLNRKTGIFFFSRAAAVLLEFKEGDQIQFLQDEKENRDWYIEKVKKDGFAVRLNSSKNFAFNNTAIARKIVESVAGDADSVRLLIAGQSTEYNKRKLWALLCLPKE